MRTHLGSIVLALTGLAAVAVFAAEPADIDEEQPAIAEVKTPPDGYDALLAEVRRRSAIKRDLVDELIAGRRRLADVAAVFEAMDADRPGHILMVRHYPGATARERYSRVVIGHVAAALRHDPRWPAVRDRLAAELAEVAAGGN
jgi:hypothetical protein